MKVIRIRQIMKKKSSIHRKCLLRWILMMVLVGMSDLTIFDVDNQNYIALVPVDNDDEVIFYRYFEDEEGNPSLENIDR